jgi:hypothetical protein
VVQQGKSGIIRVGMGHWLSRNVLTRALQGSVSWGTRSQSFCDKGRAEIGEGVRTIGVYIGATARRREALEIATAGRAGNEGT